MERSPAKPGGVTDRLSGPSSTRQPLPEHLLRVGPEPAGLAWLGHSATCHGLGSGNSRKVAPLNSLLAGSPHLPAWGGGQTQALNYTWVSSASPVRLPDTLPTPTVCRGQGACRPSQPQVCSGHLEVDSERPLAWDLPEMLRGASSR